MPGFIGKQLCEDLVIVPERFDRYRELSEIFKETLRKYDPDLFGTGLDEVHMDITDYCAENKIESSAAKFELVSQMRAEVKSATGLTCSAGIGHNRMTAKICSDRNKPDGQFQLSPAQDEVEAFMR